MKGLAKKIVDATLVKLATYVYVKLPRGSGANWPLGVVAETQRRAVADSVDYAESRMARALVLGDLQYFRKYAFGSRSIVGLILEFGVGSGRSINYFASLTHEQIYGFDSFEGLHEDCVGWSFAKGDWSLGGMLPEVAPNVSLVKGWFNETLPRFLADHPEPVAFMHVDSVTYEAARTVLDLTGDRLTRGAVVVFDEYFGARGWRLGEFKAWQEFVAARGLTYEYLAFSDQAVAVVIK